MIILLIEIWIQLFAKKVNVATCLVVLNYLIKYFFGNWNMIENDIQLNIMVEKRVFYYCSILMAGDLILITDYWSFTTNYLLFIIYYYLLFIYYYYQLLIKIKKSILIINIQLLKY